MKGYIYGAAVVLLVATTIISPALAAPSDQAGFSAVQGIRAEALSVDEMQAISGQLNAYDIAAALVAEADKLAKYPRLQAADLKLAAWYSTNAVAINAAFAKFGLLTPCKTCSK